MLSDVKLQYLTRPRCGPQRRLLYYAEPLSRCKPLESTDSNPQQQQEQEASLPQTDRATRYVNQNPVNGRNKLYNKSATNRGKGVKGLQLTDLLQTATTRR